MKKIITVAISLFFIAFAAVAANQSSDSDCCKEGSACCYEGSECCKK